MKNIFFKGNVPYLAVLILIAVSFYTGFEISNVLAQKKPKVAFAGKGATITEALLSTTTSTREEVDKEITKPIVSVIKKYIDNGYLVIDSSLNQNGAMEITGIPKGAIDITNELRAAVKLPEIKKDVVQQKNTIAK
jgi:hypothetical protein